jgi:LAO/AO transport system kinase
MEIADLFVINKADRLGADQLTAEVSLRVEQDNQIKPRSWAPPVVRTVAVEDQGIDGLWHAIEQHRSHLQRSGLFLEKRRERTRQETLRMIHDGLFRIVHENLQKGGRLQKIVDDILERRRDPYSTRREILKNWLNVCQDTRRNHESVES